MADRKKPRAREGLIAAEHEKHGRRWVTILDPTRGVVTLLDAWEHAVLILADGTRDVATIVELLKQGVEGQAVGLEDVRKAVLSFERQDLLEAPVRTTPEVTGKRTVEDLQRALREWHRDPAETSRAFASLLSSPFIPRPEVPQTNFAPTVAFPGTGEEVAALGVGASLVLADAESLLAKPTRKRKEKATEGSILSEALDSIRAVLEVESFSPFDTEEEVHAASEEAADVAQLLRAVDEDFKVVESREREEAKRQTKEPELGARLGEAERPVRASPSREGVERSAGVASVPRGKERARPKANVMMQTEPDGESFDPLGATRELLVLPRDQSLLATEGAEPAKLSVRPRGAHTWEDKTAIPDGSASPDSQAVFERLRLAGLKARGRERAAVQADPSRRRDLVNARLFDEAIRTLSHGELGEALTHFARLKDRLPASPRVEGFIEAIHAVRRQDDLQEAGPTGRQALREFEGAVEEAMGYGRCPSCLAMVGENFERCFACGFNRPAPTRA